MSALVWVEIMWEQQKGSRVREWQLVACGILPRGETGCEWFSTAMGFNWQLENYSNKQLGNYCENN